MMLRARFVCVVGAACMLLAPVSWADEVEERDVDDFDSVVFATSGELILEQSGENYVRLEGDEDVLEDIITRVKDGRLIIKEDNSLWTWSSRDGVTAYVGVDELEALSVTGSGSATVEALEVEDIELKVTGSGHVEIEEMEAEDVEMKVSGSGSIDIQSLKAGELEAAIAGSGRIDLRGEVESQDIRISGSGDYRARDLSSTSTDVAVSGSGDVDVNVDEELDVIISGSGSVRYEGKPSISKVVSGSGSVKPTG